MKDLKEVLKILTESFGPSGMEEKSFENVKKIFEDEKNLSISLDKMGNIIIFRKGDRTGKIGFFTHNDEIGLIVTKIDGDYLRFTSVGGYDEKVLLGQEVTVFGEKIVSGIIGATPPHLQKSGESDKLLKYEDLYVDLAMKNAELKKYFKIGDRVLIKSEFTELKNDFVSCKSIDNRGSAAAIINILNHIKNLKNIPDLYFVLNAQEETTMAGSLTAAYSIQPDIAVVVDVTFAKQPGVESGASYDAIGIARGAHICSQLCDYIIELVKRENIKYEIEPVPQHSGTDAYMVQTARGGIKTILLSLPIKNMHSPREIVNLKTIDKISKLLSIFVSEVDFEKYGEKIIK
ncbi:MAG: hypothetical protein ABIN05_02270 [candidate division WOR-3 bacterium]